MQTIEIYDTDENYEGMVLGIHLKDILTCISEEEQTYQWVALNLCGAHGDFSPVTTIDDLEDRINHSAHGVEYLWQELLDFSNKLGDATDMLVVGNKQKKINGTEKSFEAYHRNNDITLELFDRRCWIITSNSPDLIDNIKNKFHDVRIPIVRQILQE